MIGLLQRVLTASVQVDAEVVAVIKRGLLVFVAVEKGDDTRALEKMSHKLLNFRVFSDADGKMNLSALDVQAELLLVSQFTLAADTRKGLRPGFSGSAEPNAAEALFNQLVMKCRESGLSIKTGVFGADMQVSLVNDGPVTFSLKT
jgi:D-tyrosyl-tRNA(Tyr) deacylase